MQNGESLKSTPSVVRLAAGETTVDFHWHCDRWFHEARTSAGGTWTSVEGVSDAGDDPAWPRSPVLTEVSLVDTAGRSAVLGVGRAGRSHFSLCVTPHPELVDTLLFEAACRINARARWLGSTYHAGGEPRTMIQPPEPCTDPPATISWRYTCGPEGMRPLPPSVAQARGV